MFRRRAVRHAAAPPRLLPAEPSVARLCADAAAGEERASALRRACVPSPPPRRSIDRCIRVAQNVGGVALLIDAKNERAARWYESYGALGLDDARFPSCCRLPSLDALK